MTLTFNRLLALALLSLLLAGCGLFGGRQDPLETLPVEEMYAEGKDALMAGNYSRATRYYSRLVSRFPFGEYTEQAFLDLAYAQFKGGNTAEATSTLNRFIRTYPTHRHIDYAYYLKALINFSRENIFLERFARLDMTQRDQGATRQSFDDFAVLVQRFPSSRYAGDARQRMVYLRNLMARHELGVGLYYLKRGAFVAAANRGRFIIENYPQSQHQNDALALMAESYARLGEETLANDTRRVLELNDAGHPWLSGNWPNRAGWWWKLIPFVGNNPTKR